MKRATDQRVNTFIRMMRHSGLRISDTTVLAVASLHGTKLKLYQAKTGEHVFVPPAEVALALRAVKRHCPLDTRPNLSAINFGPFKYPHKHWVCFGGAGGNRTKGDVETSQVIDSSNAQNCANTHIR